MGRKRGKIITVETGRGGLTLFLSLCLLVLCGVGCTDRDEKVFTENPSRLSEPKLDQKTSLQLPSVVTVPENIRLAWTSIRVEVVYLVSGKKGTFEIGIGEEKEIAGTGLRIKALNFLPAFQMDGHVITSRSNELENPAAQIEVYEGDNQIFKGWLFSLYPTTHAFTHPGYSLTLVEGIAVDKKQ